MEVENEEGQGPLWPVAPLMMMMIFSWRQNVLLIVRSQC
jgi:hypothetical protein